MKKLLALGFLALFLGTATQARANKEDDAKKAISTLRSSKDTSAKVQAAIDIGHLGQIRKSYATDAIPYLVECCKDKDAKLRAAAAESLGKVDPPEETKAADVLAELVKSDKAMEVKMAATRGLGAMGANAKSALPTLQEVAGKEDKKSPLTRAIREASMAIKGGKK